MPAASPLLPWLASPAPGSPRLPTMPGYGCPFAGSARDRSPEVRQGNVPKTYPKFAMLYALPGLKTSSLRSSTENSSLALLARPEPSECPPVRADRVRRAQGKRPRRSAPRAGGTVQKPPARPGTRRFAPGHRRAQTPAASGRREFGRRQDPPRPPGSATRKIGPGLTEPPLVLVPHTKWRHASAQQSAPDSPAFQPLRFTAAFRTNDGGNATVTLRRSKTGETG